jgi:hypothetical protein
MTAAAAPQRVRSAFRVVEGALLAVRVMLAVPYIRIAAIQTVAPVRDHFFPPVLRHPTLLLIAFFMPMIAEIIVLSRPARADMKRAAAIETLGAAILLLHQATYFYATWVIVFWAGLFLVWLAWSGAADERRATTTGPFLAQLLTAFFFLGGAAGKWTAGYWSGEVFYDIFFGRQSYFVYSQLRVWFDDTAIQLIAKWFSRSAVVVETSMALVVFLPARLASTVSVAAALGLWFTSADLFEVAWPLIGVALAGRLLASPRDRADSVRKQS